MKIWAIALNTFREAIRNKVLYSVVFFAAFVVAVSALFGSVTIGSTARVVKDFGLFSLSFFGAVTTVLCGISLLQKELKQKTIYNIISKPVERWQFIVGKFFGLVLTSGVIISLMGLGVIAFSALFEDHIDPLLFQGLLFALLESVIVAAVTIFFSSIVVTTALTGLFAFSTYLAGRSISYLTFFLTKGENYNPTLAAVVRVLDYILPDLNVFNHADTLIYGQSVSTAVLVNSVVYAFSYSVVCLVLAILIFNRRELN